MTIIRAMFVGQYGTMLPEDRVVSTFHFLHVAGVSPDLPTSKAFCAVAVQNFYSGIGAGAQLQSRKLVDWMAGFVNNAAEVRVYNLDDAKPRVPDIFPWDMGGSSGRNGLPEECAVVLSLEGFPPVTARRRGRLYFGPLWVGASDASSTTTPTRVTATLQTDLIKAAFTMAQTCRTNALEYSIRSSLPAEHLVAVKQVHCDDAFDTQRRRGPKPTARQVLELF